MCEIGESDGTHFIAMEFVDGKTLGEKIDLNPRKPREGSSVIRLNRGCQYVVQNGRFRKLYRSAHVSKTQTA